MPLPAPEPGLVIPYAYLWRHEKHRGLEEGRKVRPAVIVLAVARGGAAGPLVTVVPVTHSAPTDVAAAMELPARVKQALGLDDARSWIVLEEVNQFTWPGFDVRPVPRAAKHFHYGYLPPKLFTALTTRFVDLIRARRVRLVDRD